MAAAATGTGYDYAAQQSQQPSQAQSVATGYVNPMYQSAGTNYFYNQSPVPANPTGYDYGQYGQQAQAPQQPAPSTASSSTDVSQSHGSWPQLNQQFSSMNLQQPTAADSGYGTDRLTPSYSQPPYTNMQAQVSTYHQQVGGNQQYPTTSYSSAAYPSSSNESTSSVSSASSVQDMHAGYANYAQAPTPQQYQQPPQQIPQVSAASSTQYYQQAPYQSEQTASYGSHPGYSYNPQTGAYDYTSGFQYDSANTAASYQSQYVANPQIGSTTFTDRKSVV